MLVKYLFQAISTYCLYKRFIMAESKVSGFRPGRKQAPLHTSGGPCQAALCTHGSYAFRNGFGWICIECEEAFAGLQRNAFLAPGS